MPVATLREIFYICPICKEKRSFIINTGSHLSRKLLQQLGVTTYYDIHFSMNDGLHGVELTLDANFNLRDKKPLGVLVKKTEIPLPSPTMMYNELSINQENWVSWKYLKIIHDTKMFNITIGNAESETPKLVPSPFGTVSIEYEESFQGFHEKWFGILSELLEYTSKFNLNTIEDVLRYVDTSIKQEISPGIEEELILRLSLDLEATILTSPADFNLGMKLISSEEFSEYRDDFLMLQSYILERFSQDVIDPLTIETLQSALQIPLLKLSKMLELLFIARGIKIIHTYSLPEF